MKTYFKRFLVITFLMTLSYAASAQWYAGGSIGGSYSDSKSTNTKAWAISINEHIILKTELDFAGLSVSGTTNCTFSFGASAGGDNAINLGDDLSIGFIYKF